MKTTIFLATVMSAIFLMLISFQGMIHTQALTILQNQTGNTLKSTQTKSLHKPQILIAIHALLTGTISLCRGSPAIISKCQEALRILDVIWLRWPAIVCGILISFCFILYGLSDAIYSIGFLLLSQIVYAFAGGIDLILIYPHCQWLYPYQQTWHLKELPPCPCET
jgi:hypothetical protein